MQALHKLDPNSAGHGGWQGSVRIFVVQGCGRLSEILDKQSACCSCSLLSSGRLRERHVFASSRCSSAACESKKSLPRIVFAPGQVSTCVNGALASFAIGKGSFGLDLEAEAFSFLVRSVNSSTCD